jgi:hypothetical protein
MAGSRADVSPRTMRAMRSFVLVLVLLLAGAVAFFVFGPEGDVALPAPTHEPTPTPSSPGDVAHGGRVDVAPRDPGTRTGTQPTPPTTPDPAPTPPTAPATVVLAVRDMTTRAPVAAFRWQFRNSLGTLRGEGKDGRAELPLPATAVGELLVEAEGLAPAVRDGVIVPTPPAPPLQVDVFLPPAVAAAGITLFVHDLALQPTTHVRVDAFLLAAEAPPAAWHLGQSLWARRASAPDGRYVLPPLTPGVYGIRIAATDEQGGTLPLQPWLRTFALTGDNGFVEDVPLEPGALLALDLVDAAGQPFDPTVHGKVTLSLRLPGGPVTPRKWMVRAGGVETAAIDVVPGVGKVQLADAVAAGHYQLEVQVHGALRAQQQLFLRSGVENRERLVVP